MQVSTSRKLFRKFAWKFKHLALLAGRCILTRICMIAYRCIPSKRLISLKPILSRSFVHPKRSTRGCKFAAIAMSSEYNAYLNVAIEAAKEAGTVITEAWHGKREIEHKGKQQHLN